MPEDTAASKSQLIPVLREGLSVIQMVVFKELRAGLALKQPAAESVFISMLAGAVTNEIFGTANPEQRFVQFRRDNWGAIEQEMLSLRAEKPELCAPITDALRVQALCDSQEGLGDDPAALTRADALGILIRDRDIPLPSTFMTMVRDLGSQYNLITPPVQTETTQEQGQIH